MKQNKVFVAITGGIGSGKSSALACIKSMGYPSFSADEFGRGIYKEKTVFEETARAFPHCIKAGEVDRKMLAETVFSDPEKLKNLNAITHPAIMKKMFAEMERAEGRLVFAEVPLLFEEGYESLFDEVIVLVRAAEERIGAVAARDGISREDVSSRIKNQWDYEKNLPAGHTVIYNEGDIGSLDRQVTRVVQTFAEKYHI